VSGDAQHYARVPAELGRAGWQRTAARTATAGAVTGYGTSASGALADLGKVLARMAGAAHEVPSFWWDEANGQLHVAVPDSVTGGHHGYIVRMTGAGPVVAACTSSGAGPASQAYANAAGMARVPQEGRRTA